MKLTFCGNVCSLCPRFIATVSGDPAQLEEVRQMWVSAGWREESVTLDDMRCLGCSAQKECRYHIIPCAIERQVENCGLCSDYSCEKTESAFVRTEAYQEMCEQIFSNEDYERVSEAFFHKERNLNNIQREERHRKRDAMRHGEHS